MGIDSSLQKLKLIELIMGMNDSDALTRLEEEARKIQQDAITGPDIAAAIRPIRSNVSLEEIMQEQNYQPISFDEFGAIADKLDIQEPIEELLAMLTK